MDKVVNKEHYNDFLKLKRVLSLIKENEVLVRVGAYKAGMDPELDNAMAKRISSCFINDFRFNRLTIYKNIFSTIVKIKKPKT